MSCRKSCKKWRQGLCKSFKILFCAERYVEDISRSSEEVVNMHLGRKTILPSELENKLVEYCVITDQSYYGLRR